MQPSSDMVAAAPPQPGGAGAGWHRLIPGQYFEVEYEDDEVAHERLALWPIDKDTWVVRSPDGDVWAEDLSGQDPTTGPFVSRPVRRRMTAKGPHAGALPPLYRFRERLGGVALKTAMVRGLGAAVEVSDLGATPVVTHVAGEDGERLPLVEAFSNTTSALMREAMARVSGATPASASAAAAAEAPPPQPAWRAATASETPRDEVWIYHEAGPSAVLGGEAHLAAGRDVVAGGDTALVLDNGKWILARRVAASEAPALAQRLRGGAPLPAPVERPPVDLDRLGLGRAATAPAPGLAGGTTEDARTLWVDWDAHGERCKPWREVCREASSEDLEESRVEGPVTALHMCKAMEREGGDPRMWLERWLREKRLDSSDRVAHELRALTDVLFLSGSVDQLNVGGLHGMEALCRRIAAIVEAYATGRPTWEHARFYAGTPVAEEVVAPALHSQVLRRAREEAELSSARSRGVPRGGATERADGDGTAEGGGGGAGARGGRGAGRGRGKGGRGDQAPAEA